MTSEQPEREVNDEGVRAPLVKLDEMSDAQLRELVRGEPQIVVEAGEGIIARRHSTRPQ